MTEAPRRIHCQTYRNLAALKVVLDKLGKKLAPKDAERMVVPRSAGNSARNKVKGDW